MFIGVNEYHTRVYAGWSIDKKTNAMSMYNTLERGPHTCCAKSADAHGVVNDGAKIVLVRWVWRCCFEVQVSAMEHSHPDWRL